MLHRIFIPFAISVAAIVVTSCGVFNKEKYTPTDEEVMIFFGFVPNGLTEEEYEQKRESAVAHMDTKTLRKTVKVCNEVLQKLEKHINSDLNPEDLYMDERAFLHISEERASIVRELKKRRAIAPWTKEDRQLKQRRNAQARLKQ